MPARLPRDLPSGSQGSGGSGGSNKAGQPPGRRRVDTGGKSVPTKVGEEDEDQTASQGKTAAGKKGDRHLKGAKLVEVIIKMLLATSQLARASFGAVTYA